ncbi:MAG: hypothetical protein FWH07_06680 [Oscillospiraceae bacterium]|nr:hypothetical protein [Oscillospiraceae bacterium]
MAENLSKIRRERDSKQALITRLCRKGKGKRLKVNLRKWGKRNFYNPVVQKGQG